MRFRTLALTVISIGALSCSAERLTSTSASDQGLALETSISAPVVAPGQTMTFTYQLRNVSSAPVTVIFGGCGPLPYIANSAATIVYPGGGGWLCPGAIRTSTLAPGQAISETVDLRAGRLDDSRTGAVTLPSGRYRAYADVAGWVNDFDHRIELRSPDLTFNVRE
jgi:hypothetical protein